jgi:chromosome segregation ATPase
MKLREQLQASTRETRDSEEVCPPQSRALFGTLPLYVRAVVWQNTRLLTLNKSAMSSIVKTQTEVRSTVRSTSLMVMDLQQNTSRHRQLFALLSRDIQWIKEKQHDRKRLKQANFLLHEKNNELLEKLASAGNLERGLDEALQVTEHERDAARQQTLERHSALKETQRSFSELEKERDRLHMEVQRLQRATDEGRQELQELKASQQQSRGQVSGLEEQLQALSIKAAKGETAERQLRLLLQVTGFQRAE